MARPYGGEHQRRRREAQELIDNTGGVRCGCTGQCSKHHGQCKTIIRPGDPWHLGHGIPDKHGGDGTDSTPWCPPCNSRDAANLTNHPANNSRDWWNRPTP